MGELSAKVKRLAVLLEPDIARMLDRQYARMQGCDAVDHDAAQGIVTYSRGGEVAWTPHGEPIGRLELGVFRWWWHGTGARPSGKSRLERAIGEGERYSVPELLSDQLSLGSVEDAELLCQIAAQLSRADGVLREEDPGGVSFVAIFDSEPTSGSMRALEHEGSGKFSIAPPSPASSSETPPQVVHSLPPPDAASPLSSRPVVQPSREAFLPLAQQTLGAVGAALPAGFGQALLIVIVDTQASGKARFFVQIVATDAAGDIVTVDAPQVVVDGVAALIAEDARVGNGRWRKLIGRLRRTARGAHVEVQVYA